MTVFVVCYQNYVYADSKCWGESEPKYLLNENFEVRGVFTAKEKAEEFIDEDVKDISEGEEDWIEHYKDRHYFIEEHELD